MLQIVVYATIKYSYTYVCSTMYVCIIQYRTRENFGRGKIDEFGESQATVFAKIFLANIHRYTENVFGISTDFTCSLFAKFFLANSFYLYGSPKFFPTKIFLCTVFSLIV